MKQKLKHILEQSAAQWAPLPAFEVERPKVREHGDLSTNLAMILARTLKKKPIEVAQEILAAVKDPEGIIESSSIAGAGFINFTLKKKVWHEGLRDISKQGPKWGQSDVGQGKKVVIEYVSANPTGPLHIGNARGGPLGDALAALLSEAGHKVTREYYVNDVGGQIDKLGDSILYWLKHENDSEAKGPEGYQGEYVKELAATAKRVLGEKMGKLDDPQTVQVLGKFGMNQMTDEIKRDCEDMGIRFDSWVYEKEVLGSQETDKAVKKLVEQKVTTDKDGAVWFVPQDDFIQDRECVLIRSDGRPTYFANDIAYHARKYEQGYDLLINVWGSNHHGHVPRVQAAMKCLGYDPNKIETVLYQYVRVKRGADAVKMSKRAGNFVTAREVLDEVGRDAFRFFLLMRAPESHLDFDLELATKHSQENPVYYVQYAHARLASIERKAVEAKIALPDDKVSLESLDLPEEIEMIRALREYPEEVARAALRREPHRVPFYLLEIAKLFQAYYAKAKDDPRYRVLAADVDTSRAKLYLCRALKLTLAQGLRLLGVSAPETMENPDGRV